MTIKVFSAGFGRTGTLSLKQALEQLGFGPCHHMEEVIKTGPPQVRLWSAAADGKPDFEAIFDGYHSAVDWPTAAFWREMAAAYPDAKVILSSRTPESWVKSFSDTILKVLLDRPNWPPHMTDWLTMVTRVVIDRSLGGVTDPEGLMRVFKAHEAAVKAAIPANRLLVHSAKDGWEPLCAHLGVPVPATPYPRTNSTEEFFELMKGPEGS